jgi:hypothetical protein
MLRSDTRGTIRYLPVDNLSPVVERVAPQIRCGLQCIHVTIVCSRLDLGAELLTNHLRVREASEFVLKCLRLVQVEVSHGVVSLVQDHQVSFLHHLAAGARLCTRVVHNRYKALINQLN